MSPAHHWIAWWYRHADGAAMAQHRNGQVRFWRPHAHDVRGIPMHTAPVDLGQVEEWAATLGFVRVVEEPEFAT